MLAEVYLGDCLDIVKKLPDNGIALIYLDPPFLTQKIHRLGPRDRTKQFSFNDIWKSSSDYSEFLLARLSEFWRVLATTGSLFFHCDSNASHIARLLLDEVFGRDMFRSEIIWHYRRWSNSQKTLLRSHQNIYFYSKTSDYKFNHILQEYSSSTNVDQILQRRKRDAFGKTVYDRDANGMTIPSGDKKGVPLNDVWDIPFLNPKAKERVGYPTQKPILLLERIIQIVSDEGDSVLDPFCGSGTTLVAAELLRRRAIGIDLSPEAVQLTKARLETPIRTNSQLLGAGRESYRNANLEALGLLKDLEIIPVHRNSGIDAFLKSNGGAVPIPIRVQRCNELLIDAAYSLQRAAGSKNIVTMILVRTEKGLGFDVERLFPDLLIIDSPAILINAALDRQNISLSNDRTVASVISGISPLRLSNSMRAKR